MYCIVTVQSQTADFVYDLTTVEAVNAELNLASDTANDALVASQITVASQMIAVMCDRVFALQSVSQLIRPNWHDQERIISLARFPVDTFSSLTINDVEADSTSYDIDYSAGLIYKKTHVWHGEIIALYSGGYNLPDDAPATLSRACIELIKAQRFNATRDQSIRDVWHGETRVSYFGAQSQADISTAPPSVLTLIQPFKRLAV